MRSRVNTIQTSKDLNLQAVSGAELVGISLMWSEVNKSSEIALRDIGTFFFLNKEEIMVNKKFVSPMKQGAESTTSHRNSRS